ncbi:glycosyltransferase family 2 protein [Clostridiaceae bacterium]|nr:glycosyltransferase family 2 protein [Clostridiaceae bacterium]
MKEAADITVVLTAYKRVDSLRKQLEAIEKQSLKPAEIWLFQDRVVKDYTITIDNGLLERFDHVQIERQNAGVWGRFQFARSARTAYVCIFDDDTIPGSRWLENCLTHMQKQRGIYGTIGIVSTSAETYVNNGHVRVGWARPNEVAREVDFVGHSWFLETQWLEYMFDGTKRYQAFKYAAEDMTLSYACQKHGIHTYVPPHPSRDKEWWGSYPDTALQLGVSAEALSLSGNEERMERAFTALIGDGWSILLKRNPAYVAECRRDENRYRRKRKMETVKRVLLRGWKSI